MNKKKILLATQNQNDMTSFLRSYGIFTHPTMKPHVEIIPMPSNPAWVFDWTYFYEADVVYLHRPGSQPALDERIIDMSNKCRVPLWVDLDDDLENITQDNPVWANYSGENAQRVISSAIRRANVLTCGGERHKKRLEEEYHRDVILIPNALDDRLIHLKRPFEMNRRVAWRGSESHRIDLHFYEREIANIINTASQTCFYGLNPYQFDWLANRKYQWSPPMNLMDYYRALTEFNASLHIVPLLETEFNMVKSNLAWSDATLAGSVCLAPNFGEYVRPGVYTYEPSRLGFDMGFKELFFDAEENLRLKNEQSWSWICENILVSKVNQKRLEILRNL